tara:strand:- start:469 stop:966 length:498 start_codon:yes stop_codon:yes gene_type:complete
MNYLRISLGIFLALAASRFIPHPPNFTSLIALSFYVPAILGTRFIPALVISFFITDLIIGFHSIVLFSWGSVLFIGIISRYFKNKISTRILGMLFGCAIFYVITNFGVWLIGGYGYTIEGLIACYVLAIPFFGNTLAASIIYSAIIESIYKFYNSKNTLFNSKEL